MTGPLCTSCCTASFYWNSLCCPFCLMFHWKSVHWCHLVFKRKITWLEGHGTEHAGVQVNKVICKAPHCGGLQVFGQVMFNSIISGKTLRKYWLIASRIALEPLRKCCISKHKIGVSFLAQHICLAQNICRLENKPAAKKKKKKSRVRMTQSSETRAVIL